MTNLKKVLSAMLSATVLVASGAMMASAEDAKSLVSFDPADWVVSGEDPSVMEIEAADGAISFSNTNGQWPAASYLFDEPITVDPDTAVLNYDMTIGGSTNFNLFCNTTTQDDFTGKESEYFSPTAKLDIGSATLNDQDIVGNGATIKGSMKLSELGIKDGCYNEDGTITINGINIFSIGTAGDDSKVTVRELSISTDGSANNGGNSDNTTAAAGNNGTTTTKKTNPSTGESTAMVASGVVLAVVAAGAVVLTAKKKNH